MMSGQALQLSVEERRVVEETIRRHCEIRGWSMHAVNVRSNHIHVVVTVTQDAYEAMRELKIWCSRRLSERAGLTGKKRDGQKKWWTEKGKAKPIEDAVYLQNAVNYVTDFQE